MPAQLNPLKEQISHLGTTVGEIATELQELSRGIHPAILSKGGLSPALKTLARRSAIPVELVLRLDRRLPDASRLRRTTLSPKRLRTQPNTRERLRSRCASIPRAPICTSRFETTESAVPTRPRDLDCSVSRTVSRRSAAPWRSRVIPETAPHWRSTSRSKSIDHRRSENRMSTLRR